VASTEQRGSSIIRGGVGDRTHLPSARYYREVHRVSHREANYPDLGDRHQNLGTVWLFYTLLGNTVSVPWSGAPRPHHVNHRRDC
jgi:hypothetical protein